jgi:hypothetical protein
LAITLVLGTGVALVIRRLAWRNVKAPLREWALVTLVAGPILFILYATGALVEIASVKIPADDFPGAITVGLMTGLAGRQAVDRPVQAPRPEGES